MLNNQSLSNLENHNAPDYDGLIRFLVEPLLESPELLSFNCEYLASTKKVWIRLALEDKEKGKIYGRGGRNIQAIRTVLQTAAQMAGDNLYLEIHEEEGRGRGRNNFKANPPNLVSDSPHRAPQPPVRRRRGVEKPII
ncbi:MAG: KH domain-containing protein [Cyanobacterium sp. T60_A2020_053]|nr:KH domain-containing protein [Cyanobacterium sp. T60_A2020_053]